jgi:hypothetical protein
MPNSNYLITIQSTGDPASGQSPISVSAPMPDEFAFDVGATYEQMLPQGFLGNRVINVASSIFGTKLAVQAMTAQLWAGNTDSELSMQIDFHTETNPLQDVRTPIVNLLKLAMPSVNQQNGFLTSPGPQLDTSSAGSIFSTAGSTVGTATSSVLGGVSSALSNIGNGIVGLLPSGVQNLFGVTPTPATLTNTSTQPNNGAGNSVTAALQANPTLGTASYWNQQIKNRISITVGSYLYFQSVVITRISQTYASNFDAQTGWPHHVRVAIAFKPLFMLSQQDLDTLFVNPAGGTTTGANTYGFSIPTPTSSVSQFPFTL